MQERVFFFARFTLSLNFSFLTEDIIVHTMYTVQTSYKDLFFARERV